jgi:hypothetical protein
MPQISLMPRLGNETGSVSRVPRGTWRAVRYAAESLSQWPRRLQDGACVRPDGSDCRGHRSRRHGPVSLRRPTTPNPERSSRVSGYRRGGDSDYEGNNFDFYTLRGIHVQMLEHRCPSGCGREVSSGRLRRANSPELHEEVLAARRTKREQIQSTFAEVDVEDRASELLLTIPDHYRVGHEARFAEVTRLFFTYLDDP